MDRSSALATSVCLSLCSLRSNFMRSAKISIIPPTTPVGIVYNNETDTHGRYAFREGLRLGLALGLDAGRELADGD